MSPYKKISFLEGGNGCGKSFLMIIINDYCDKNDLACLFINSKSHLLCRDSNKTRENILKLINDYDLFLFDNADMYMDNELLSQLKNSGKWAIIAMKQTYQLNMEDTIEYGVEYTKGKIIIEEWN